MNKRVRLNIGLLVFIILLSSAILMPHDEVNQVLPRLTTIDQKDIFKIEVLRKNIDNFKFCLLYTSDAADDSLRVDLGGRRIIKKIQHTKMLIVLCNWVFFQAEDGIRDRSPSRGLGDVYKRQQ